MDTKPNYAVVQLVLDKRDARLLLRALNTYAKKLSVSSMNRVAADELIEKIKPSAKALGVKESLWKD